MHGYNNALPFTSPGGQFRFENLQLIGGSHHVQLEVARPHGLAVEKVQVMLLQHFRCVILDWNLHGRLDHVLDVRTVKGDGLGVLESGWC